MSGIDTSMCSAGSVRPAAVSKARVAAVPVSCIMAKVGWYRESALAKYYNTLWLLLIPFRVQYWNSHGFVLLLHSSVVVH